MKHFYLSHNCLDLSIYDGDSVNLTESIRAAMVWKLGVDVFSFIFQG